jgi:hypothetical protein
LHPRQTSFRVRVLLRWTKRKAELTYPVPPAPPTAVLQPWFRSIGVVQVRNGWAAAAALAPAAIAGTWPQLEALIQEKIPSLTHALIVLARPGEELLTAAQRERLWKAFRVPVFQQVVTRAGELLAAECEAHDGLHMESPRFVAIGLPLDRTPCGCGRKTPRLKFTALRAFAADAL